MSNVLSERADTWQRVNLEEEMTCRPPQFGDRARVSEKLSEILDVVADVSGI
jgi:hypothetical protein